MKKLLQLSILCLFLFTLKPASAQVYTTSGGEMIFSWSNVTVGGVEADSRMRWSPVFNLGTQVHFDGGEYFGVYSGIDVKNIGFIYQDPSNNNNKVIQRTYNAGIPVGIKIGNLRKFFFYGGYQFELPVVYKYKSWDSSDRGGAKTKFTQWFSDATPTTMHSFFAGVQFYGGLNLKFRYYLNNFVNPDYVRNGNQINAGLDVQVFSISLVASLLKGADLYSFSEEQ